jgi:2-polyprenyl-3-methyl-5-hydroxy-6-metoxy-1,4-benzoquinol methylase
MMAGENLYAQEYFEYLHHRGTLRKFIRKFYLRDIRSYCSGRTIDFGCGVGELLAMLPAGSTGFEVNEAAVNYCRSQGLDVQLYEPEKDNYEFRMIENGKSDCFTMNHVLEHLENPSYVIEKIFDRCHALGINRIVFTVPGIKGYQSDATHRTFIDLKYFEKNNLFKHPGFRLTTSKYFPFNSKSFSRFFTHNELRLIFDRRND